MKVWNGFLIDGHNRYKISEDWDLNYEVCEIERPNRDAIKAWIAKNQLGRRNISDLERIRLARIAKPEIENEALERMRSGKPNPMTKSSDGRHNNTTRHKLAKAAGVGEEKFRMGEAILDSENQEIIDAVNSGEISINHGYKELKRQEEKRIDLSSRASLADAEERHENFQNTGTVSIEAVRQDKEDAKRIAEGKRREVYNAIKKILFFNASKADFSIIKKNMNENEVNELKSQIAVAISTLSRIKEEIGG